MAIYSGVEYHTKTGYWTASQTDPRWFGSAVTSPLLLVVNSPRGCVLSHLLFTLYTHDCSFRHHENSIVKPTDGTDIIISRIMNNNESLYREEINNLAEWCTENNLLLNVSKTKKRHTLPVYISGAEVKHFLVPRELVNKTWFLCQVCVNFYSRPIASILTRNITNWHGSCTGSFCSGYGQEDHRILKDNTHKSYSCIHFCSTRLQSSFIP